MTTILVDLTSPQHSPFGKVLYKLYYQSELSSLAPGHTGYPHHGAVHAFRMRGEREDCLAYLDLVEETFPEAFMLLAAVRTQINAGKLKVSI